MKVGWQGHPAVVAHLGADRTGFLNNQFDLRIAKNFRFGGTRTSVGFDLTNVLNANPVLTCNEAFSTSTNTWLRPNSVLQPRLAKFSAQFNF